MILVVDDHKDLRTVLVRLLNFAGHETASASGGAEALQKLREHKPSLMVLDVHMPGMDGLSVLRTMRQNQEWKDVPVLMFSADSRFETIDEAKRLGVAGFLVKGSFGSDNIITRICEFAGEPPRGD